MLRYQTAAVVLAVFSMGSWGENQSRAREQRPSTPGSHRFGVKEAPPRNLGAIRIAAYNTLNLFDHADDPNLQGEFDDLPNATPPERLQGLADAIKAIDADIIALAEVESLEALRWFRDTYLADAGYEHLASEDAGYYRGVEQSVMSRFPIVEKRVWLNESLDRVERKGLGWTKVPEGESNLTFQRSPLLAKVQVRDDYQLTILALHHKAGPSFSWHREAEALRVVELIREIEASDPSTNVIAMGDFNCAPWDKSLRVYLQAGMVDTLAYRIIDRENPETVLYKTHESDKVLDYVLMNSAAYREYVPGSGFVFGTTAPPANYDYRNDPKPANYASDHYPVVVELIPTDRR